MNERNKAKEFEKGFSYGKGVIPTPGDWISYFWDTHRNKIMKSLENPLDRADSILFVGVGSGDILPSLNLGGKTVFGIDLNLRFLVRAAGCCHAVAADSAMLPFKNNYFDMVVCNMVLHHVVGQGGLENTIAECSRVLRRGGRLLAFEPNLF